MQLLHKADRSAPASSVPRAGPSETFELHESTVPRYLVVDQSLRKGGIGPVIQGQPRVPVNDS